MSLWSRPRGDTWLVLTNMSHVTTDSHMSEEHNIQKIQALRDMISNAERTIQSAKAMLLQLEGKKKSGRKRKVLEEDDGSKVIQGTFDGQIMQGTDGKQYPVPANYASKSKLVEGDMLKLTITIDGSFIYKQIGPAERKHAIGVVTQDEHGSYYIIANGKPYRVLLASVTYFKAEPGDEAVIVIPRDLESNWGAIENIIQKAKFGGDGPNALPIPAFPDIIPTSTISPEPKKVDQTSHEPAQNDSEDDSESILDRWTQDIKAIEEELKQEPTTGHPDKEVKSENASEEIAQKEGTVPPLTDEQDTSNEDLLEAWRADVEEMEREIQMVDKTKSTSKISRKDE